MADYAVSNRTYNIISTLHSKLEAVAAYDKYIQDLSGEEKMVFEQLKRDDERHAEQLCALLERIAREDGLK